MWKLEFKSIGQSEKIGVRFRVSGNKDKGQIDSPSERAPSQIDTIHGGMETNEIIKFI